ncbi:MAG: peptidoglycan-binding protein, partial [Clostridia bacterium]
GALYFYNPRTSTSRWIFSRPVKAAIGNHRFAI